MSKQVYLVLRLVSRMVCLAVYPDGKNYECNIFKWTQIAKTENYPHFVQKHSFLHILVENAVINCPIVLVLQTVSQIYILW